MNRGSWHCTGDRDQDHLQEKEIQKSKVAVWGGLTNSCEKKGSQKQRRKKDIQAVVVYEERGVGQKEQMELTIFRALQGQSASTSLPDAKRQLNRWAKYHFYFQSIKFKSWCLRAKQQKKEVKKKLHTKMIHIIHTWTIRHLGKSPRKLSSL